MGYESKIIQYEANDVEFTDLEKLNEEISELKMNGWFQLDPDGFPAYGRTVRYGPRNYEEKIRGEYVFGWNKWYDLDMWALKVSKYLKQGYIRIVLFGEEGEVYGYDILPGEVYELGLWMQRLRLITEEDILPFS